MALLQSLSAANLPRTFSELATLILTMITKKLQEPRGRADFIIDQYPEISIKNIERDQRATRSGSVRINISGGAQKCPQQWSKFLSIGANKSELVHFFAHRVEQGFVQLGVAQWVFIVCVRCWCMLSTVSLW